MRHAPAWIVGGAAVLLAARLAMAAISDTEYRSHVNNMVDVDLSAVGKAEMAKAAIAYARRVNTPQAREAAKRLLRTLTAIHGVSQDARHRRRHAIMALLGTTEAEAEEVNE